MGAPDTIPDLQLSHPDGTPLTRIEAEVYIRETLRKVHWLRILANKRYGLPKQFTFGMTEIMIRHWFLDEAIRRGEVVGNQVGVNLQNYSDENEIRQFTLRLAAMIQAGQAVTPKEGEGIDMANTPQPPPGNNQPPQQPQGFIPPPPPPMGMAGPPQQQYAPPPQPPPQPPQPPQGYAPPQAPAFTPPPQGPPQNFMPPQGPPQAPMMPPGYAPTPGSPPMMPQGVPPQAPPQQAAPTTGRRGRGRAAEAPMTAPPQMPQSAGGFVPQLPPPQQGFFPLPQQPQMQMPAPQAQIPQVQAVDLSPLLQRLDQLAQTANFLARQLTLSNLAISALSRAVWGKQGSADIEIWLKEIGVQIPQ